jgi:hypothetical protein
MECSSPRLVEGRRNHRLKRCSIGRLKPPLQVEGDLCANFSCSAPPCKEMNVRLLMSIAICAILNEIMSAARVPLED